MALTSNSLRKPVAKLSMWHRGLFTLMRETITFFFSLLKIDRRNFWDNALQIIWHARLSWPVIWLVNLIQFLMIGSFKRCASFIQKRRKRRKKRNPKLRKRAIHRQLQRQRNQTRTLQQSKCQSQKDLGLHQSVQKWGALRFTGSPQRERKGNGTKQKAQRYLQKAGQEREKVVLEMLRHQLQKSRRLFRRIKFIL